LAGEVALAELALDDDQGHALARHFDGVGMAELVRREAPAHPRPRLRCAGVSRGRPQLPNVGRASPR